MTTTWRTLALLAWVFLTAAPAQAGDTVARAALPDWVEAIAPPAAGPAVAGGQSTVYLLVDNQTRVEPSGRKQQYRHFAMQATDPRGVESVANIELSFDPSYQTLTLHRLRVHRGGQVQERLPGAQVRVLQRERELETLIYDGSRSANIFLDDVRVGDVVEYAYSLDGSNPVFGGRQAGVFDLQWSSPLTQLRVRLLWPANRPLTLKTTPTERAVASRPLGAYTEYRLAQDGVPALRVESDAPSWYSPHALLFWSEWVDWGDVARWAVPLYATPASLPPALRAERDRILAAHTSPAERAAAALRWVQREVRYLGIEVGANSHAPTPPATVVARRFGDCKDKTLLTVTLLRALGLQAEPALVHTQLAQGVQQGLPRPSTFNHVIVHLTLDGRAYWLDPTRAPQPGGLDAISQPDWGLALVVAPQTRALTAMDSTGANLSRRDVHVLLDGSRGLDLPAQMTVTTELSGRSAEAERSTLATDGNERVQQRYQNFYARSYPGLRVAAPLEVLDDLAHNHLRVVEHYELDKLMSFNAEHKRREAALAVPEVLSHLSTPTERVRAAPLALAHPMEVRHELEVRLPEAWQIKPEVSEIDNPAFSLRREVLSGSRDGDKQGLRLVDHYRSRADHVDAPALATYLSDIERARDAVGYEIYKTSGTEAPPSRGFNLPVALLALAMLAGWVKLARRVDRWDPTPGIGAPARGLALGGLLWLPLLGLVATLLRALHSLWLTGAAFETHRWAETTVPGGARYHPLLGALMLTELALLLGGIAAVALALRLFWQRRSSAPRVYVAVLWAWSLWSLLDDWLGGLLLPDANTTDAAGAGKTAAQFIVLALWSRYLLRGQRPRDTFVQRHAPTATAPPQAPADNLATATPG